MIITVLAAVSKLTEVLFGVAYKNLSDIVKTLCTSNLQYKSGDEKLVNFFRSFESNEKLRVDSNGDNNDYVSTSNLSQLLCSDVNNLATLHL